MLSERPRRSGNIGFIRRWGRRSSRSRSPAQMRWMRRYKGRCSMPHAARDVGEREPGIEVQPQDRPLLGRQIAHRRVHGVGESAGRRAAVARRGLLLDRLRGDRQLGRLCVLQVDLHRARLTLRKLRGHPLRLLARHRQPRGPQRGEGVFHRLAVTQQQRLEPDRAGPQPLRGRGGAEAPPSAARGSRTAGAG